MSMFLLIEFRNFEEIICQYSYLEEKERIERFLFSFTYNQFTFTFVYCVKIARVQITRVQFRARTRAQYVYRMYMNMKSDIQTRRTSACKRQRMSRGSLVRVCSRSFTYCQSRSRLTLSRSASRAAVAAGCFARNAERVARPLTCRMHTLAPRVTHVLAKREACRVSEHANKIELVPLRTRWLENNAVISLEAPFPSASLENATPEFISAAICVYVTNQLWLRTKNVYG